MSIFKLSYKINMKDKLSSPTKYFGAFFVIMIFFYIIYVLFFEKVVMDVGEMKQFVKGGDAPF
jgi:hypothetical protein